MAAKGVHAAMIVNVADAKTHLSRLIDKVCHGETVVIAKNNQPMVDLVKHQPSEKRNLGLLAGRLRVPADFTARDSEVEAMFYGEDQP